MDHERRCPEARIYCPNAGCGERVARQSIMQHRGVCRREEVACPCPGCEVRMARAEVDDHVEASGAVHARLSWKRTAELAVTVTAQAEVMEAQGRTVAALEARVAAHAAETSRHEEKIARQGSRIAALQTQMQEQAEETADEIAGLCKRGDALTRVFMWSSLMWTTGGTATPIASQSEHYRFAEGVRGFCFNNPPDAVDNRHWMGFTLHRGPEHLCGTMHFRCSILDKQDKVLRVVSALEDGDCQKPPTQIPIGQGAGAFFDLTEADKLRAVRADRTIKFRTVVHLYLPE